MKLRKSAGSPRVNLSVDLYDNVRVALPVCGHHHQSVASCCLYLPLLWTPLSHYRGRRFSSHKEDPLRLQVQRGTIQRL